MNKPAANERLLFGFPEEWADFQRRHTVFLELFPHINEAIDAAFTRVMAESELVERFVMLYGRLCIEDFFEIMLCCGNGYGMAATKLLRALYEKAVTLEYLNDNPPEIDNFIKYGYVSTYKLIESVVDVFGADVITEEVRQNAKTNFQNVKDRFLITKCETCHTTRVNHTWTKLDLVAMAKRTRILGKFLQTSYYIPMRHTHSTINALFDRLGDHDERIAFNPEPQRKEADDALEIAHTILLEILHIQQKRFNIEKLEPLLSQCVEDWKTIYGVDDEGNRVAR